MIDYIDGVNTDSLIDKIKSRGFWRVVIKPNKYEKERFRFRECKEKLWQSKVSIRGWTHPFIYGIGKIYNYSDYVEHVIDWDVHLEVLRMYTSGQYIHLFALWEDWLEGEMLFRPERKPISPGYGLEMMMTLYTITEIYEFATRFCKEKFQDGINLSIELNGIKARKIVTFDFGRFLHDHTSKCNNKILNRETTHPELVLKKREYAIEDTIEIFEAFNWDDIPKQVLENEQEKILK